MNTDALRAAVATLTLDNADLELLLVTSPSPQSKKRSTATVQIDAPLGAALRVACQRALDDLQQRHQRDWDERANPTSEEALFAEGDVIKETAGILAELHATNVPTIGAHALEHGKVRLYAVAFGTGADRFFFVQRRTESIVGTGKILTRFIGDQMHLVTEPSLVLPTKFEALFHPLGVVVLHGDLFERMLRDDVDVTREVGDYVTTFQSRITLDGASGQALTDIARRFRYMRKRLRNIVEHPRFAHLTVDEIRAKCVSTGIEMGHFFAGDNIKIDGGNADRLVRFLNDEVYRGTFGNELLAADGTAPF